MWCVQQNDKPPINERIYYAILYAYSHIRHDCHVGSIYLHTLS